MVTWMTTNWIYYSGALAIYLAYRLGYYLGNRRGYQQGSWDGEKVGYNRRKNLEVEIMHGGRR